MPEDMDFLTRGIQRAVAEERIVGGKGNGGGASFLNYSTAHMAEVKTQGSCQERQLIKR